MYSWVYATILVSNKWYVKSLLEEKCVELEVLSALGGEITCNLYTHTTYNTVN
jgi:hypothetical protein